MNDRNDELARLEDELRNELLITYPNETEWMLNIHGVRALWTGGYDLLGSTYRTAQEVVAAQREMILSLLPHVEAPEQ